MLSSILQLAVDINDATKERKEAIAALCCTAYPDIKPWQVQQGCEDGDTSGSDDIYYVYQSILLDPIDGNEIARQDDTLVNVS